MSEHDRVRIDDLNPTGNPSEDHELAAMHEGQTHKLTVAQIAAIARLFDGSESDFSFSSEELGAALRELGTALEALDQNTTDAFNTLGADDVGFDNTAAQLPGDPEDVQAAVTGAAAIPMSKAPPEMTWVDDDEISIAAGRCRDEDDTVNIVFPSSLTLTTSGLSGATWYHILAGLDGDGDPAVTASPTIDLPSGWQAYRRIGSWRTNGSTEWLAGFQVGDRFLFATTRMEIEVTNQGETPVTRTLDLPTGVPVIAILAYAVSSSGQTYADVLSVGQARASAMSAQSPTSNVEGSVGGFRSGGADDSGRDVGVTEVLTNTSAQVVTLGFTNDGSGTIVMSLYSRGYIDRRGRDK